MQIQISSDLIDAAIVVIFLLFLVGLCIEVVVLVWYSLRFILSLLNWTVRWATGGKDLLELARRFDRWTVETRERQIARGAPTTLRGALCVLAWRVWKAYTHPIRAWRGEFLYPSKRGVRGGGDYKP